MNLSQILKDDWNRLMSISSFDSKFRFYKIFNPRFFSVFLIRLSYFFYKKKLIFFSKLISLFNFIFFGIEVPLGLKIGPGLVITHTNGIVLGAREIGCNFTLFHQVTLGALSADFNNSPEKRPIIEDNVTIYCGAKILGPIKVCHSSTIGANSVVINDVRANSTVIGIPAREIKHYGIKK